jgi:bacterial/archaeal transporter family-2 protein
MNNALFAPIMLAAGIGIPIMASANALLGARLGSPASAAAIMFALALAVALLVAWATGGPQRALLGAAPWPYYFGGLLIAFYLLSITYLGPRLGIGTAVLLVLLGQIVAAAAIDHFGLLGAPRTPLTLMRAAGLAMMAGGVLLARRL